MIGHAAGAQRAGVGARQCYIVEGEGMRWEDETRSAAECRESPCCGVSRSYSCFVF